MIDAFWVYLTVQAIGLAAFPLAYILLNRLTDRGYFVSKALGILLLGYASWMLSVLHILPSVRLSIIGLLLVMGGFSGWYVWGRRREFKDFLISERKAILAGEIVFLLFYVGWAIYRAYDPAIDHTEQPMDFAFFNASIQTSTGAPEDPWLRGHTVSYYYFGYWMMGVVSQLAGIASSVAYNLSLALIPALAAIAMFGLVYNLIRAEAARWTYAIAGGFAAVFLLIISTNLEGVLEFMRINSVGDQGFYDWVRIDGLDGPLAVPAETWAPQDNWWWFRATRVINTFDGSFGIDYTIQEFPFFSFMLGDLHPHVMSIPFVILFLVFCWNFLLSPIHVWRAARLRSYISLVAMGLVLGGLAFTNMWDGPIFSGLFLGVVVVKAYQSYGGGIWSLVRGTLPIAMVVIGLAGLLFLPYYLTFSSSLTGIHIVETPTRPVHTAIVWGLYLVAVVPFVVVSFWQTTVTKDWPRLTGIALLVGLLPYLTWALWHLLTGGTTSDLPSRFFHIVPFAVLIVMAVYNSLWLMKERGQTGKPFAMILAALGLLLIMGPELLLVGDSFGNRMNTVFKLYYQAWILLAVASGCAVYYWSSLRVSLSGWPRALSAAWAAAFVALLVGSLYYAAAAPISKGDPFHSDATLDGLAYIDRHRPGEYEAIRFVRENVGRGSAILEAVGGDYSEFGRISASTGVPTVLNWPGHEVQWRGSVEHLDGREEDVAQIYRTQDVEEAKILMASYDVDYVYVGHRERQKYGEDGLDKFGDFMDRVFDQEDVAIYRLRR